MGPNNSHCSEDFMIAFSQISTEGLLVIYCKRTELISQKARQMGT